MFAPRNSSPILHPIYSTEEIAAYQVCIDFNFLFGSKYYLDNVILTSTTDNISRIRVPLFGSHWHFPCSWRWLKSQFMNFDWNYRLFLCVYFSSIYTINLHNQRFEYSIIFFLLFANPNTTEWIIICTVSVFCKPIRLFTCSACVVYHEQTTPI